MLKDFFFKQITLLIKDCGTEDKAVQRPSAHISQCHNSGFFSSTSVTPALVSRDCTCMQVMLGTWVRIPCEVASQFKKSQTAVSTTERYLTLYVVCLILVCTRIQRKGNSKKNIQIVAGRLIGWKWI